MIPIFLDFEGVLRPAGDGGPFLSARLITPALIAARQAGVDFGLIVASTHRRERSWKELAEIVDSHAPGLGQFFAGANPHGPDCIDSEEDYDLHSRAPRLFESLRWMQARPRQQASQWIAIDDTAEIYGRDGILPSELMLIDGAKGFTKEDGTALLARLLPMKPSVKASGPA